jgi:hypothetical protein
MAVKSFTVQALVAKWLNPQPAILKSRVRILPLTPGERRWQKKTFFISIVPS